MTENLHQQTDPFHKSLHQRVLLYHHITKAYMTWRNDTHIQFNTGNPPGLQSCRKHNQNWTGNDVFARTTPLKHRPLRVKTEACGQSSGRFPSLWGRDEIFVVVLKSSSAKLSQEPNNMGCGRNISQNQTIMLNHRWPEIKQAYCNKFRTTIENNNFITDLLQTLKNHLTDQPQCSVPSLSG